MNGIRALRQIRGFRTVFSANNQVDPRHIGATVEQNLRLDDLPERDRKDYQVKVSRKEDEAKMCEDDVNAMGQLKFRRKGVDEEGIETIEFTLQDYFMGNEHHTHNVFQGYSKHKQGKKVEQRTFIDLKLVRAVSGKGGNGAVSFFRDAFRPVGPPDGGDGGAGGDVYIQAVNHVTSLHKVKRSYQARGGASGLSSQLDGKKGDDVIIEVPVGTTIKWVPDPMELRRCMKEIRYSLQNIDIELTLATSENDHIQFFRPGYLPGGGWIFKEREEEYFYERQFFTELDKRVQEVEREMIFEELNEDVFPILGLDLTEPTANPIPLIKGGRGGMGNMHFLTKDIRNPRFSKKGREGLKQFFLLELKLIADLGLVGLPNAGKSTLLRAISKARPRVGHWEFTTLQPTVGTIFTTIDKDPFTVADIPGIIEGASDNRGMGLDFLRHIERSGGLVFVISLQSPDPWNDLNTLIKEVGPKRMDGKRILVVATKADLETNSTKFDRLKKHVHNSGWKIVPVCAPKGENIERCIKMMSETAQESD